MTDSTLKEAQQVHAQVQQLIDTLGGAGIPESVVVVAMQQALIERLLASGGVGGAQRWLRDQADQLDEWGELFLAALRQR